jgi:hypothetical protein
MDISEDAERSNENLPQDAMAPSACLSTNDIVDFHVPSAVIPIDAHTATEDATGSGSRLNSYPNVMESDLPNVQRLPLAEEVTSFGHETQLFSHI